MYLYEIRDILDAEVIAGMSRMDPGSGLRLWSGPYERCIGLR
jgi:hypothetical protein